MTINGLAHVRDGGTEPGYRVEGDRLAARAALRCWTRERGGQWPVAADGVESAGAGAGSLRLKITLVNPQTTPEDLDELVELIAAAGAAEDRP